MAAQKKQKPAAKAKPKARTLSGHCTCGAVRFVIEGAPANVYLCHCSKCRRWFGHVGAYVPVPRAQLTFTANKGLRWFDISAKAQRGFCGQCGAGLFYSAAGDATVSVCPGALESPTGLTAVAHMFTASKGDYYEVGEDGVPQFDAYPE